MKTKIFFIAFFIIGLLVLCNQHAKLKPDSFSTKDMCIRSDRGSNICYGMSRQQVEKILGQGEGNTEEYYYAGTIYYRDDKVVGISLSQKNGFQTPRGIHIGSTKEEAEKKYGAQHKIDAVPNGLLYSFYQSNRKPLEQLAIKKEKPDKEREGICQIWIMSDDWDRVSEIMLFDERLSMDLQNPWN